MGYKLLFLGELLDLTTTTCIGYKNGPKNYRIPCSNPISKGNIHNTNLIRDAIRSGANIAYVQEQISVLATLCPCKSRHQQQAADIAEEGRNEVTIRAAFCNNPSRTQAKASTSVDQVFVEMEMMDAELDRHDQQMQDIVEPSRPCLAVNEETLSEMEIDDMS